jgi:probable HAF family extracellular repeat protein
VPQNLGLLPQGTFSSPFGINDSGAVVGVASVNNNSNDTRAFYWRNGSMQDIGLLSSGGVSHATAINERGLVVGSATVLTDTGQRQHAFHWRDGFLMTDIGTLDMGGQDGDSAAYAINEAGVIVGESSVRLPGGAIESHAFRWENGVMTDLGTLPGGTTSSARDINGRGEIVGWSTNANGQTRAVLWDEGGIQDLGALDGDNSLESVAEAINDLGQIVGYSSVGPSFFGFLYENTVMKRLDNLIDPTGFFSLSITRATDINNRGDIVALGSTGSRRTILLRKLCRDTDGNGNPDNDGDGLCDNWETSGIDGDGDGYGNVCDADLNNNGVVNVGDLSLFRQRFGSSDAAANFNGLGVVNAADLAIFRALFGAPPGPSATAP